MNDFARRRDARETWDRVLAALDNVANSTQQPSFYFLENHLEKLEYYDPESLEQWWEHRPMVIRQLGQFQGRSPYWLAYEWDNGWGNQDYIMKVRTTYGGIDMIWANVLEGQKWLRTNFMFVCFNERAFARRFRLDHEGDEIDYRINRPSSV